jgi:hypothetical protein
MAKRLEDGTVTIAAVGPNSVPTLSKVDNSPLE